MRGQPVVEVRKDRILAQRLAVTWKVDIKMSRLPSCRLCSTRTTSTSCAPGLEARAFRTAPAAAAGRRLTKLQNLRDKRVVDRRHCCCAQSMHAVVLLRRVQL